MARGTRPAGEASIDSPLGLARQPRDEQGQQEENNTDGDNTSDEHRSAPQSTHLQRHALWIRYERPVAIVPATTPDDRCNA